MTISYTLPATSTSVTTAPNPSTFGQPVALTATVTGASPTGTVTFTTGTTTLCANAALNNSGVATCTTSTLPVGSDTVTATYNGDTNNASSHGSTGQTVTAATTALTAAPASLIRHGLGGVQVSGLSATLTDKTTGAPISGQTITFSGRVGNLPLCTAVTNANGTASCTATFNKGRTGNILPIANLVIFGYTATYTPIPGYTGSTANARVTDQAQLHHKAGRTPRHPRHTRHGLTKHNCITRRGGHHDIRRARPADTPREQRSGR